MIALSSSGNLRHISIAEDKVNEREREREREREIKRKGIEYIRLSVESQSTFKVL